VVDIPVRQKASPYTAPRAEEAFLQAAATLGTLEGAESIVPEDFTYPMFQAVFRGMKRLQDEGQPIEIVALTDELERMGKIKGVRGRVDVSDVFNGLGSSKHISDYARELKDRTAKRKARLAMRDLQEMQDRDASQVDIAAKLAELQSITAEADRFPAPLDFSTEPEPIRWLLDPIIPERGICLLVAQSGIGKSWIALQQAICVADGRDWLEKETPRFSVNNGDGRPVFYVDAENPPGRVWTRVTRLAKGLGIDIRADHEAWSKKLYIWGQAGISPRNPARWLEFIQRVRELNPCLVVFDTAPKCMAGTDADAAAVKMWFDAIQPIVESGASIEMTMHAGWNKAGRVRGPSQWRDNCDTELDVVGEKPEPGEPAELKVQWGKGRDTEDTGFTLHRLPDAGGLSPVLHKYIGEATAAEALKGKVFDFIYDGVKGYRDSHDIRKQFPGKAGSKEYKRVSRAETELKAESRIESWLKGYRITEAFWDGEQR